MIRNAVSRANRAQRAASVLCLIPFLLLPISCGGGKRASAPTAPPDTSPPGTVVDLAIGVTDSTSVTLQWTAPGGDGQVGTAAAYEIRYGNTDLLPSSDWSGWTVVASPPVPHAAGAVETLRIPALPVGTPFAFALRSKDVAGNWSGESNVALGHTAGYRTGPVIVVASQSYPYARYSENGGRTWRCAPSRVRCAAAAYEPTPWWTSRRCVRGARAGA